MGERTATGLFEHLETDRLNLGHLKVILLSGMGFFTDAYDLFNIGVMLLILTPLWGLTNLQKGLLASAALWATIAGQLLFGRLLDVLGRKRVYGIEAAILGAGALASAFAVNFTTLLITRVIMGLGIGGDYPASSTIASEYAPTKNRGRMVALVFSMQGVGIATAVVVGLLSVAYLPPDLAWRVVAAVGAIPPLFVIYYRRRIPETPRYSLLVKGDKSEASKAVSLVAGSSVRDLPEARAERYGVTDFMRTFWLTLIGTAVPWLLMDVALYGTGVFSSDITATMIAGKSLAAQVLRTGVPLLIGVPGYFIAAYLVDSAGRKNLQTIGFSVMTFIYALLALSYTGFVGNLGDVYKYLLFGLSFTFINLGPNTTTFIIPAEVYPVRYRSTGHGISAASGKVGAALSTMFLPLLQAKLGVGSLFALLALVSIGGALTTVVFTPEAKGLTLEEASRERLVVKSPQPLPVMS
jgi:PHS family inorganic phosphate transporter-like MFS transporter